MYKKISMSVVIATILMSGCSDDKQVEQKSNVDSSKEQSATHAPVAKNLYGTSSSIQAKQSIEQSSNTRDVKAGTNHIATVLETMNAANYTYAKVEENGNVYWVAGPESAISVGAKISFIDQMVMENFTSKSLGKTFESIVFASTLIPVDKAAVNTSAKAHDCDTCGPDGKPKTIVAPSAPHAASKSQPINLDSINVAKATGGHSVEELHTKKADLKDKKIKVNAKVVKVSKNIMKKDWIHLQDGSGVGPTSDIVVTTTNSAVNVGDTVLVNATLKTDVDFGYGYFFGVILEEGKISKIN